MTTVMRRRANPVADLLNWFANGDVLTVRVPFDGSDAESRRIPVQRQKA